MDQELKFIADLSCKTVDFWDKAICEYAKSCSLDEDEASEKRVYLQMVLPCFMKHVVK